MGACIVSISNKMQRYTVYLYLDINKLCNVAACSIYIGILLGAHPILHISRIKVKGNILLVTSLKKANRKTKGTLGG
jgi:hypothetical protein